MNEESLVKMDHWIIKVEGNPQNTTLQVKILKDNEQHPYKTIVMFCTFQIIVGQYVTMCSNKSDGSSYASQILMWSS